MSRSSLSNEAIAVGLDEIARLLAMDTRQAARSARVARAAESVRACLQPVVELVEQRSIEGVHLLGIDYELAGVITDWVRSGHLPWLERLKAQRRDEVAQLPNIGPRLAQELRAVLGVEDLDGLAEAVRSGRLASVCGFGPKRTRLVEGLLAARSAARAPEPARQASKRLHAQPAVQHELFAS